MAERLRQKIYDYALPPGEWIDEPALAALARFVLDAMGINPAAELSVVLLDTDAMAAALRDGSVDAIITHEPDAAHYLASGAAFELVDLASPAGTRAALGSIYPSTTLYMTDAYIDGHRPQVAQLVKACLRALAYINSHSADEIAAILPPAVVGKDRAAFVAMLTEDKQAFATDGQFPREAARQQLAVMAARSPKYAAVNVDLTYTNGFIAP